MQEIFIIPEMDFKYVPSYAKGADIFKTVSIPVSNPEYRKIS